MYNVKVAVLVDYMYDGNSGTINDQLALEVEKRRKGWSHPWNRILVQVSESGREAFDRNVTKKGIPKTRYIVPVL